MSDYADLIRRLDEFICGVPVRVSCTTLKEIVHAIEALVKERDTALRDGERIGLEKAVKWHRQIAENNRSSGNMEVADRHTDYADLIISFITQEQSDDDKV